MCVCVCVSPTLSGRRHQKQWANHSSLSLHPPRRRPLPLPSCSANGLSASLTTGQSAAGSEFLSKNREVEFHWSIIGLISVFCFFLDFFFFFFKCIFLVVVAGGAFSLSHIFDWLSLLFVMFIVLSEGETSLTDPNPPGVTTRDAAHTDGTAEDQKVRRGCVNRNHNKK